MLQSISGAVKNRCERQRRVTGWARRCIWVAAIAQFIAVGVRSHLSTGTPRGLVAGARPVAAARPGVPGVPNAAPLLITKSGYLEVVPDRRLATLVTSSASGCVEMQS